MAEAEAIEARAKALERNDEAVINVQIAEQLPEIVRAASESFKGIDNLVVLNGAQGMSGMLGEVMGAGLAGASMFRDLFDRDGNGTEKARGNGGARSESRETS